MEKRELKMMSCYYYGISKVKMIWQEEIEQLHKDNAIRKIYEIIDFDFNEQWYLVRDKYEKSYIVKSEYKNTYAKDIMKKYEKIYNYLKVNTEVIKMFDKGIFPIVFKVSEGKYKELYNEEKNKSDVLINNFYCYSSGEYKVIRKFRNKVEFEKFKKEEDAIYWCSDYTKTKEDILKNNIRPLNLKEKVYEYKM